MDNVYSPDGLNEFLKRGRYLKIKKGQVVQSSEYRPSIIFVKKGFVKRYLITNEGTQSIQSIFGPLDVFPLTLVYKTLFNQKIYSGTEIVYYETMTACELYSVTPDELKEAVQKDPTLYKDLFSVAGLRFNSNIQQLENLSLKSSYMRVAHELAYLAQRFGRPYLGGTLVKPNLTHQDIANVLSVTRETVSLCIVELRKKGLISTGAGIVVPDIDKLLEEAAG